MKKPLPQLKTAMTPFPYSIDIEADCDAARALLVEHDFHHLPVTEGGQLVGMLTAGKLAAGGACELRGLCEHEPYIVDINERLSEVLTGMARLRVDAAIVVKHGKLAGVFTAADACRVFAELLDVLEPPPGDGDEAA
ncbi:MAG: CBS domain-containing protein [Proteobacteria bacterium]|nr:CBS domain-containing protein [Pseudomonadota bacterium]